MQLQTHEGRQEAQTSIYSASRPSAINCDDGPASSGAVEFKHLVQRNCIILDLCLNYVQNAALTQGNSLHKYQSQCRAWRRITMSKKNVHKRVVECQQ